MSRVKQIKKAKEENINLLVKRYEWQFQGKSESSKRYYKCNTPCCTILIFVTSDANLKSADGKGYKESYYESLTLRITFFFSDISNV